jgi:hypothetical protein
MSAVVKSKKKDRSNVPIVAGLIGCVLSAYGFSRQNPLFLWMIPLALVGVALLWAFWPRPAERSRPSGGA